MVFREIVVYKPPIFFNQLSDLPREAQPDRPAYQAMGVHSTFMVQLFAGEARHIVILQTMEGWASIVGGVRSRATGKRATDPQGDILTLEVGSGAFTRPDPNELKTGN